MAVYVQKILLASNLLSCPCTSGEVALLSSQVSGSGRESSDRFKDSEFAIGSSAFTQLCRYCSYLHEISIWSVKLVISSSLAISNLANFITFEKFQLANRKFRNLISKFFPSPFTVFFCSVDSRNYSHQQTITDKKSLPRDGTIASRYK